MTGRRPFFARYLTAFILWILLFGASTLILNLLVDPLWYSGGNRFFPQNYAFNERFSKTNLYLSSEKDFDCFIFGASRATLLNASKIRGHSCFNFAFSDGKVDEHIAFARYLKNQGANPRLLIVSLNEANFLPDNPSTEALSVPDFVQLGERPPNFWRSYLSLDVLDFSIRTLRKNSPLPRFYTETFAVDVLPSSPAFKPRYDASINRSARPMSGDRAMNLKQLREIFPRSRMMGYVPPLNLWSVAAMERDGELGDFLDSIYEASGVFDELVDFSVPSAVTADVSLTYDGSHYYPPINDRIIERLFWNQRESGEIPGGSKGKSKGNFGLDVKALSLDDYAAHYADALLQYSEIVGIASVKPE